MSTGAKIRHFEIFLKSEVWKITYIGNGFFL